MLYISRFRGYFEYNNDDERTKTIRKGMKSICNQSDTMNCDADSELNPKEDQVDNYRKTPLKTPTLALTD